MKTDLIKDRLLVIDDELGPRESLRFLFKDLYEVSTAESVDRGLEILKKAPHDCVISDIKMPGKTGIQGLKEIRALDPHVSIVMLTGYGSLETAQESIRHGATDYLKKPFDAIDIREMVAGYIRRTKIARKRIHAVRQLEELTAQLQQQIYAKEQLASLGEQSAEFAHDLSNPIGVIHGYVQLLLTDIRERRLAGAEINISYLEQIEKCATRCRDMLVLWKERSVRSASCIQKINVGTLIGEIATSAEMLGSARGAEVRLVAGPDDCMIEGDSVQIFRAIQNIVGNALEALPHSGGLIQISWKIDCDRAVIEVKDNGGGFESGKLKDMKSRHYTTKGASGGMGLGLFITKNIAEAHNGQILLANTEDGSGAKVSLIFPLFI